MSRIRAAIALDEFHEKPMAAPVDRVVGNI